MILQNVLLFDSDTFKQAVEQLGSVVGQDCVSHCRTLSIMVLQLFAFMIKDGAERKILKRLGRRSMLNVRYDDCLYYTAKEIYTITCDLTFTIHSTERELLVKYT